jgi:hypothetical protein
MSDVDGQDDPRLRQSTEPAPLKLQLDDDTKRRVEQLNQK